MKNKKAGEGISSPPDLDQEYELRTSAPQEEMERYYARKKASLLRKLRQINKKIKKNIYNPYANDNEKHKNAFKQRRQGGTIRYGDFEANK